MLKFTSKTEELAKLSDTTDIMRIYCSFISNWIQMYQNDDLEGYDMHGGGLDNIFSSFNRPIFSLILDTLFLEFYAIGLFKKMN